MIKARYDEKKLSRWDVIINPFLTIMDLPWLAMMLVCLVLAPHRFIFTFLTFSMNTPHFPKDEMTCIRFDIIAYTLG